jgi:hypothetical protein
VDVTGNQNATMKYIDYEEQVIFKYGVELVGWTFDRFVCPSSPPPSLDL